MKTAVLALLFCFVTGIGIGNAEPFARKVEIPDEMLEPTHPAALDAMTAKNSRVPSQEEVGIPAYPDGMILQTQQPSNVEVNGKKIKANHMVSMGTTAKVDQVLTFYRERLSNWSYKEVWGTHILSIGDHPNSSLWRNPA